MKYFTMVDLGIDYLINESIISAQINEEKTIVILITPFEIYYLTWTIDCRENCFLAEIQGANALIDTTIKEISHIMSVKKDWEGYYTEKIVGTIIKTDKGSITLLTRIDGRYSRKIRVSNIAPIDHYYRPISIPNNFKPLKDF